MQNMTESKKKKKTQYVSVYLCPSIVKSLVLL